MSINWFKSCQTEAKKHQQQQLLQILVKKNTTMFWIYPERAKEL